MFVIVLSEILQVYNPDQPDNGGQSGKRVRVAHALAILKQLSVQLLLTPPNHHQQHQHQQLHELLHIFMNFLPIFLNNFLRTLNQNATAVESG